MVVGVRKPRSNSSLPTNEQRDKLWGQSCYFRETDCFISSVQGKTRLEVRMGEKICHGANFSSRMSISCILILTDSVK